MPAGKKRRSSTAPAVALLRGARIVAAVTLSVSLAGCGAVADLLPAPPPSEPAASGPTAAVTTPSLAVGDCLNDLDTTSDATIPLSPCAAPHSYEVYQVFTVPGDDYPGDNAVTAAAESGCATRFDAFAAIAYRASTLDFAYRIPAAATWADAGGHDVACLIFDPAGSTTGSLAGATR
ncbi:septum formation family protein [Cryobacterium sp. PH31-AA6]|uniref:septum formation family protein n=1 Tax=Cryobacterium sp. PH31-AA6 TaxID=3046205 RepID=UPI0024BA5922|nr:septum formation family protein [Cryobacterium sp. PH31-AA6]MDJ0323225.1 septum formation family protein [Cryobacterium sp. PH31-AA6]